MNLLYWQAKIWGILHDPALKALHSNYGRGGTGFWQELQVMKEWKDPHSSEGILQKHILQADYITSASDRSAIGSLSTSLDYDQDGLEICHLLSAKKLHFQLKSSFHQEAMSLRDKARSEHFQAVEKDLIHPAIKESNDARLVFWWLWRCFPQVVCDRFQDDSLLLMPAETRIPDGSLWSHLSLTSAMAGALAGYDLQAEDINRWTKGKNALSRPYMTAFTFSPVQETIKASRKMRDFWASSWILHYLSARVCWALAWKYGPDCLIYPSLYAQPLIDYWLRHGINGWNGCSGLGGEWKCITSPESRSILTAGFPNVIVIVLPEAKVNSAMQMAQQTIHSAWKELGERVFTNIKSEHSKWMQGLEVDSGLWQEGLESYWQTYWSALPLGDRNQELSSNDSAWISSQNQFHRLTEKKALFQQKEQDFLTIAGELREAKTGRPAFKANIGSWWCFAFDQLRYNLQAVKSARDWQLPTAHGVRSTISGLGSALHPHPKSNEESIKDYWKVKAGLFDGREMLNASEVTKRGLHKILPQLFEHSLKDQSRIDSAYPDLTAGVAGYLKTGDQKIRDYYVRFCNHLLNKYPDTEEVIQQMRGKWGIPYADEHLRLKKYHPRLLNAGWLLEDLEIDDQEYNRAKNEIDQCISRFYPANNPADWYVISAGDGDSMSEWLKGTPLKDYADYVPQKLIDKARREAENASGTIAQLEREVKQAFEEFLSAKTSKKRMGASTHAALSRALLDFSNQLVPYLTEQRYAGRLIYGGGDDVLAYTNLWEWDSWLWDIRQCFRGDTDPSDEFQSEGDYWQWKNESQTPQNLAKRPLFTMGSTATISFGVIIAHHSVPLAIALENMWQAEEEAKEHEYLSGCSLKTRTQEVYSKKNAVQVRVIFGNGNTLKATAKFDTFNTWRSLIKAIPNLEPAVFEQAATVWDQHPVPSYEGIPAWCTAFCDRREKLTDDKKDDFQKSLTTFLQELWITTKQKDREQEVQNWLKLAAFMLRKRNIKINQCLGGNYGTDDL